jgi:hypothetical protein
VRPGRNPAGGSGFPRKNPGRERRRYAKRLTAGKTVAFRLVLHVDNNPCQAEIYETTVGAAHAGPCGFIEYPAGSSAHISFLEKHPHDFATFNFGTYRGSTARWQSPAPPGR